MSSTRKIVALAAGALLLGGAALAHIRILNGSSGNPAYWNSSTVSVIIDATGSDDILDGSHLPALRSALDAWNGDPGSTVQLVESGASPNACSTWTSFSSRIIFFDETNCSGYFPGGGGTVALTPLLINGNGSIADADIIFNGVDFGFTTRDEPGRFDVQDVGTHELGHLLGLDHSGWAGATLYPYVDQNVVLQRSLSLDDIHGMRDIYPNGAHAEITGAVKRSSDNSNVAGAHVWVRDASGRPAGGTITATNGTFAVRGLDAGTYTLLAEPLDFPVSSANIGSYTIDTDFEATTGTSVPVNAGELVAYGDLMVDPDVVISLGRAANVLPLECEIGASQGHVLTGAGLVPLSTLAASDPTVTISGVTWFSTMVTFTVDIPGGAAPAHVDLIATNPSGDVSMLPAAIEIVPPEPTVTDVTPSVITDQGGDFLTLTGTGFRSGARVVIGAEVYVDGLPGGCSVVSPTTITLTTRPTQSEVWDAVVIDATGVEGRMVAAVCVMSFPVNVPVLDNVFPVVGAAAGGSQLVLTGQDFQGCMIVRIDGVEQPDVQVDGPAQARVTTLGGVAGGPYVIEIENPVGLTASAAFGYVAQADPVINMVDPPAGSSSGGDVVDVFGTNLNANTVVVFGVDPATGQGGTLVANPTFLGPNQLQLTTPARPAGTVAVMVLDTATGQATVLSAGYTFQGAGGGGGGGCHAVPLDGPSGPTDMGRTLLGLAWLALLAFAVWSYSGFQRRRALARMRA